MEEEQKQVQSNMDSKKKISFISALLIVIGGSIGAGIFFKAAAVQENSQGSMLLAILCWIIASVAVIAMALALIEISSVRNDNLSLIGWNKVFNSRFIAKASKNFMVYVYLPLTYLFMPLYVLMSLQDALASLVPSGKNTFGAVVNGTNIDWIIWSVICLAMSIYFLTIPTLWSKVGDWHNKVILGIKFIPIVLVIVLGLAIAFSGNSNAKDLSWGKITTDKTSFADSIKQGKGIAEIYGLGAGLGMFLAVAAIFFAYDGFYVASGIQSEMKEPKKTPIALFIGLGITTIIYLLIAISLSINGGDVFGMAENLEKLFKDKKAANITLGIMNLMIAIGVLGIINGFSMWAPRYVEDLLAEGELPFWRKVKGKLNANFPIVGVIYSLAITVPVVIIFTLIGALGYVGKESYLVNYGSIGMAKLYNFADLMANWTAVFTFGFIAAAILGGIINRKKNFVEVKDKKSYFLPMAWISVITVFVSMAITILVPVIDLFLLAGADKSVLVKELVVPRVMLIITLLIFAGLSFLPTVFEDLYAKKKYGSVAAYDQYKKEQLAQ
ncbi:APC family permease [Mycoplasmopsis lipophila]|uniref:APC family permease n=1 Tax=Mycoplasmopsis lipophila TaxID=2117 RepID=UPI0038730830